MGRNVLISGASHGIGAATAIAFAKDGCNVGINYHNNRAGAEETAAECRRNWSSQCIRRMSISGTASFIKES